MIPLSRAEADVTTDAPKLESITVAIMRDARARDTLQFVLLCYLQCHFSWRKMKRNKPQARVKKWEQCLAYTGIWALDQSQAAISFFV
jgi:hypothetical protein